MATEFKMHTIKGYISNLYLLEYNNKLLLLDAGSYNDVKRIEDYVINNLKQNPQQISLCLVSHMHPDHSGGAYLLQEKYNIPIVAHERAHKWYRGLTGYIQYRLDLLMTQAVAKRNNITLEKVSFKYRFIPDYKLKEGDSLPFFKDWVVVHIPGHTLHDIAVYNKEQSLLYVADCIIDIRDAYQLPLPVLFPKKLKYSYNKIASLRPEKTLLAHGEPIKGKYISKICMQLNLQLEKPANKLSKNVKKISMFPPDFWISCLKKLFLKQKHIKISKSDFNKIFIDK